MMSNADRRVNQVEDDLETVKQLLVSTARRVESNSEAIEQLTERMDRLTERIDRLAESQQVTQNSIDRLAGLVVRLVENAEADRAAIREMQTEVRGIQTENQRILEYLFGQQRGSEN